MSDGKCQMEKTPEELSPYFIRSLVHSHPFLQQAFTGPGHPSSLVVVLGASKAGPFRGTGLLLFAVK